MENRQRNVADQHNQKKMMVNNAQSAKGEESG